MLHHQISQSSFGIIVQPDVVSKKEILLVQKSIKFNFNFEINATSERERNASFTLYFKKPSGRAWYRLCLLTKWFINIDKGVWGCYDGRVKKVRQAEATRRGQQQGGGRGMGGAPSGSMPGLCSTDSDTGSLWAQRVSANELLTLAKAAHTAPTPSTQPVNTNKAIQLQLPQTDVAHSPTSTVYRAARCKERRGGGQWQKRARRRRKRDNTGCLWSWSYLQKATDEVFQSD